MTRIKGSGWTTRPAPVYLISSYVIALAGGGPAVKYVFPVGAVLIAVVVLWRGRSDLYLELVLWLWFVAPGLRRIVDLQSGYDQMNPILLAAPLASLVSLPFVLSKRCLAQARVAYLFGLGLIPFGYGIAVGILNTSPTAVAVSVLDWVAPFLLGLFTLMTFREVGVRERIEAVSRQALGVLGFYALIQLFFLPEWDGAWIDNVSSVALSFGRAEPLEVRVFSLSNSPGPFAITMVWLLFSQVGQRPWRGRSVCVLVGILALTASQVREAWLAAVVILLILVVRRRIDWRRLVVSAVVVVASLLVVGGPFVESVSDRLSTLAAPGQDDSLLARIGFQVVAVPQIMSDVEGSGLGSVGSGVRAADPGGGNSFANSDSGYVELFRSMGPLFGGFFAALVLSCAFTLWRRNRAVEDTRHSWSVFLLLLPFTLLTGGALSGLQGVTAYVCLGACGQFLESRPEPELQSEKVDVEQ